MLRQKAEQKTRAYGKTCNIPLCFALRKCFATWHAQLQCLHFSFCTGRPVQLKIFIFSEIVLLDGNIFCILRNVSYIFFFVDTSMSSQTLFNFTRQSLFWQFIYFYDIYCIYKAFMWEKSIHSAFSLCITNYIECSSCSRKRNLRNQQKTFSPQYRKS